MMFKNIPLSLLLLGAAISTTIALAAQEENVCSEDEKTGCDRVPSGTIVITGANKGIGLETVILLARGQHSALGFFGGLELDVNPYQDFQKVYNKTLSNLDNNGNLEDFYRLGMFERNAWALSNGPVVSIKEKNVKTKRGLINRLEPHWSGQRSGD